MRFIINFIAYGLLFYTLWYFFPDFFAKLVAGASLAFDYIKAFVNSIADKFHGTPAPAPHHSLLVPLMLFLKGFKRPH